MAAEKRFTERCYGVIGEVPVGRVTTYKAVAERLGTKAYRAVGQAMKKNPNAPAVPCHRVVCSDGSLGGYAGGVRRKREILVREGVKVKENRIVDFDKVLFEWQS